MYSSATAKPFPPSSSLEPLESNPPPADPHIDHPQYGSTEWIQHAPITRLESHVRHEHWAARRQLVYKALMHAGTSNRAIEAFAECGNSCYAHLKSDHTDVRLAANCCKNRFCDVCQRRRGLVISDALADYIGTKEVRFLTLTMRASNTPLRDQIDLMYRHFSTLRRRAWWTRHVTGGAAFLECKIGANSGAWHVHLHVLVEGQFMLQKELSTEWYCTTGSSYIVDVRACPDTAARARYVTKYVTKPADVSVYAQPDRLVEFIAAYKGRRACFTFGTWRGYNLDPDVIPDGDWESLGSLDTLVRRAQERDPASIRWLCALARKYPSLVRAVDRLGINFIDTPPPDAAPF